MVFKFSSHPSHSVILWPPQRTWDIQSLSNTVFSAHWGTKVNNVSEQFARDCIDIELWTWCGKIVQKFQPSISLHIFPYLAYPETNTSYTKDYSCPFWTLYLLSSFLFLFKMEQIHIFLLCTIFKPFALLIVQTELSAFRIIK